MKKILFLVCIIASLNADILNGLRQDLDSISHEASITRQNVDYKPYIISVFTQKDLLRLGARDLEDALKLVPGVDMAADNLMVRTPIFRGSNSFAFGQSKLYIDGVYSNQILFDTYSQWLTMPLHMIKRIEVIRGPSISTNAIASYAGSVNVITFAEDKKSDKGFVYAGLGSSSLYSTGFGKHFNLEDFHIYTDFYYIDHDQSVDVVNDGIFYGTPQNAVASLSLETFSTSINVNYKDLEFIGRYLGQKSGAAFGPMFFVPNKSDEIEMPQYNLELRYKKRINEYWNVLFKAGIQQEKYSAYGAFAPAGVQGEFTVYSEGIYADFDIFERRLYQEGKLVYSGLDNHNLLVAYTIQNERTTEQSTIVTDRLTGIGLVDYSDTFPFFDENAQRDLFSVSLEDQYSFSEKLNFTFGLQYEVNSEIDTSVNPRFSAVYRLDMENIFKGTFTRSYRLPSWQEVYIKNNTVRFGNENLNIECVDAYEISYIYKQSLDTTFKSSIFYLKNRDQIRRDNAFTYQNLKNTNVYGLELEFTTSITDRDKFWFAYSALGSNNLSHDLAYSSQHLVKSYYIYNITPYFSISSTFKYNSSKSRFSGELRDDIDGSSVIDSALQWHNDDYQVTFSLENIFDEKEVFASDPLSGYIEDYNRVGRSFNFSVRKEF